MCANWSSPMPPDPSPAVSSMADKQPSHPLGDIEDAYLRRAIRELSDLQTELNRLAEEDTSGEALPVHPSGSPQAEILLVKWDAALAERQEGVAFFGRSGAAILKSVQRLGIDPLLLYGTLCAKLPDWSVADSLPWMEREIAIVRPRIVVAMGEQALEVLNRLEMPMSETLSTEVGVVQRWTPTTECILVPDIDDSLDEQGAKRAFWAAFRAIGEWHEAQPPY